MRLNFNSIKTHTQNILINSLQFFLHSQNVQNHLQRFLITLLKNMFMFTFLCRSMTFKTSHMNIKKFKRNENSKSINFTFYDDSMINMFTRTSFKRINFVQRMSDLKFISIIILRNATSKNAYSSNQFSFFKI